MIDINKWKRAEELSIKLDKSLHLESVFNIDWSKGSVSRMVQTKWIRDTQGGGQQVYKSWLQQGDERIHLSVKQYELLSGIQLNKYQVEEWRTN